MATELISDFSGGVNNTDAPNRIKDTQLATCDNCWYDTGAVKARGAMDFTSVSVTTGALTGWGRAFVLTIGSTDYIVASTISTASSVTGLTLPAYTTNGTTWTLMAHTTGTASTTSGSAVVTGSGTAWSTHLRANDLFRINSSSQFVQISSVDSDTQITLTANYSSNNTTVAYSVYPLFAAATGNGTSFETMNSLIYMSDGTRRPGNWSGSLFSTSANFPLGYFLKAFKNYMFTANTSANPTRVLWSTIKTPETWPATNFIDVNPDDGQIITGLFNDGQSLIIIKKRSLYRLSGDIFDPASPSYVLSRIYTPPECVFNSSASWVMFNGAIHLWGGSGLYVYDGGSAIRRLPDSDRLLGTFNSSTWATATLSGLESTEAGQQSITLNGKLWLFSKGFGGQGPIVIVERNGGFWLQSTLGDSLSTIWSPVIFPSANNYNNLWALGRDTSDNIGVVLLDQAFTSESISASFTTRVYEYQKKQRFGLAYLHFKRASTGSITFGYKVDEGSTVTATVDMTTGSGNRAKSPPIMIGRVGQSIQFVVSHNASTEDFEVYAIEFERQDLRQ